MFLYSVCDCPSRASNSENKSAWPSKYCKSPTAVSGALVRTTPSLPATVTLPKFKWPDSSKPAPKAMRAAAAVATMGRRIQPNHGEALGRFFPHSSTQTGREVGRRLRSLPFVEQRPWSAGMRPVLQSMTRNPANAGADQRSFFGSAQHGFHQIRTNLVAIHNSTSRIMHTKAIEKTSRFRAMFHKRETVTIWLPTRST